MIYTRQVEHNQKTYTIRLLNVKANPDVKCEYIGRSSTSILHNKYSTKPSKFEVIRVTTTEDAVDLFRLDLYKRLDEKEIPLIKELVRLVTLLLVNGTVTLGCHCVPNLCHGYVVIDLLEELLKGVKRLDTN